MGSRREHGAVSSLVGVVQALEGYKVIVELRNDVVLRGMLDAVDQYLKWVPAAAAAMPSLPFHYHANALMETFISRSITMSNAVCHTLQVRHQRALHQRLTLHGHLG